MSRRLAFLLGVLLVMRTAPIGACPVCFGAADGPIPSAARVGVVVLGVITCGVLAAFAAFFVRMARRRT
jgi:hypothetical protein